MTATPCLEAAIRYARNGFANFPVGRDKAPLSPHGFKDATTDEETIRKWWLWWPDAGVAAPLGPKAGIVLDVDPRHGGNVSLARLVEEFGQLPPAPAARTGGGGSHYWFAWPGGSVPVAHGFRPGLDLQSEGAYVVLPPSMHASGRRYEWVVPLVGTKLPLPPAWLLKLASDNRGSSGRGRFEATLGGKIAHGRHHDFIVSTAASLASRIVGISEPDLLRCVRAAVRETLDDADAHDQEVGDAVRSAISKYGRAAPSGPSGRTVRDVHGESP